MNCVKVSPYLVARSLVCPTEVSVATTERNNAIPRPQASPQRASIARLRDMIFKPMPMWPPNGWRSSCGGGSADSTILNGSAAWLRGGSQSEELGPRNAVSYRSEEHTSE